MDIEKDIIHLILKYKEIGIPINTNLIIDELFKLTLNYKNIQKELWKNGVIHFIKEMELIFWN